MLLSTAIPIVIAAIVIVIISKGIFINPIIPSIKKAWKHAPLYSFFAENAIAGVPCGIMDQLACYHGKLKHLIPFTCSLPPLVGKQLEFSKKYLKLWGIDSTVRHFNGNSSYGRVRAAAFMGRHIIVKESLLFRTFETLCSINRVFNSEQVNILHDFIEMNLPVAITGNEFFEIYVLDHGDKITLPISKDAVYYIRASVNLAPVSYTHLTLPTNREV